LFLSRSLTPFFFRKGQGGGSPFSFHTGPFTDHCFLPHFLFSRFFSKNSAAFLKLRSSPKTRHTFGPAPSLSAGHVSPPPPAGLTPLPYEVRLSPLRFCRVPPIFFPVYSPFLVTLTAPFFCIKNRPLASYSTPYWTIPEFSRCA